jgi:hypothetical protein
LNLGITASFNYTGPLTFSNTATQNSDSSGGLNSKFFVAANICGYSGSGALGAPANANFTDLAYFLASGGSASGYQYGSFYTIDLGILPLGTVLTIRHDDGASRLSGRCQGRDHDLWSDYDGNRNCDAYINRRHHPLLRAGEWHGFSLGGD